jgi:hypothetical protein
MKHTYKQDNDFVIAAVTKANGTVLSVFEGVCYGGILHNDNIKVARNNKEAKYLEVYWSDELSNYYKNNPERTLRFLEIMQKAGLFPNTEVIHSETPEKLAGSIYTIKTKYMITLKHDLDKSSAQEMFLIGNVIRTLASYLAIADDFLTYLELEPKLDVWKLFIIAHSMRTEKGDYIYLGSHTIACNSFNLLSDLTLADFYKRVECKTPLREAVKYQLDNSQAYTDLFTKSISKNIKYESIRYGAKHTYTGIPPRYYVPYSKEALETFFNEEALIKAVGTEVFSYQKQ